MLNREDLHEYQTRGIEFLKITPNAMLMADMGLGKCVMALTAFWDLVQTFDARRALVVAPLRVARRVWSAEVAQWEHLFGVKVVPIIGTAAERIAALNTPAHVHTINRENLVWLENQFIQGKKQIRPWPWDTVIADESQMFKSISSKRFKSARRLRRLFDRMWELTGTPEPNGYEDLHPQIYLLDQGKRLGATQTAFRQRWFSPPGYYEFGHWTMKEGSAESIHRELSDIVFTLREEDHLKLPPVQYNFVKVELPKPILKRYKVLERDSLLKIDDVTTVKAVNAGVLWNKLLQLANGAVYTDAQGHWEPVHDEKLDTLDEVLDGLSGPVLIAYNFVSDLERIGKRLTDTGQNWAQLKSDRSFDQWRAGKIKYGVIHPASAGHGLNDLYLSGSTNIVWFGLTPNLEHYQQLNARLTGGHRRKGKTIVIHHLVAENTIDEEAVYLIDGKANEQRGLKAALAHYARRAA